MRRGRRAQSERHLSTTCLWLLSVTCRGRLCATSAGLLLTRGWAPTVVPVLSDDPRVLLERLWRRPVVCSVRDGLGRRVRQGAKAPNLERAPLTGPPASVAASLDILGDRWMLLPHHLDLRDVVAVETIVVRFFPHQLLSYRWRPLLKDLTANFVPTTEP